jgi:L-fucose mutarotase
MTLDTFVETPAFRMEMVGAANEIPEVQQAFQRVIQTAESGERAIGQLDREAFYQRARQAYAIVITGERRTYGCILIKKGVVVDQ